MLTATAPATPGTKPGRTRALFVAGGAAAAAIAWAIEVPLLGIHLSIRFGAMHPQTVSVWQIIGAALVAGLLGWLLLAVLDRGTPHARPVWTSAALIVLALSLVLPVTAAVTASAVIGLIAAHLAVAAVVIPGLARTARTR